MKRGFIPYLVSVGHCDEGHRAVGGRQDGGDWFNLTLGFRVELWFKDFFHSLDNSPFKGIIHRRENIYFVIRQNWLQNAATTLTSCLTLRNTFDISKLQFSHL